MAKTQSAVPRRKKLRGVAIAATSLIGVGGASAGGAVYLTGGLHAGAGEAEIIDRPQLMARDGVDAARVAAGRAAARSGHPDPEIFAASYIPVEDGFTSNLSGGAAYVQIGIALSTYYDERVAANVERHRVAIRSAVLLKLAEQDARLLATTAGKEQLRRTLAQTINTVLIEREGFGGIDAVHFTGFVMQ